MKLAKNQARQIRTVKRMKDEDIDFTDIPEKTDWNNAIVGKFYRPIKKMPGSPGKRVGENAQAFFSYLGNQYGCAHMIT
jgi:hypothetical protein